MSKTQNAPLPYNPSIFAWARERAGFAVEEIADKIKVNAEKILAWEQGEASPTVRQGRSLAKYYDRPFLEFFAKDVPSIPDVELVPDFRFHKKIISLEEKRALRTIQEWAESIRINALSIIEDIGESPRTLSDNLRFTYDDAPSSAARTMRMAMDFDIQRQLSIPNNKKYKLPSLLGDVIEDLGVMVLKRNELAKLNARGMCIYSKLLPVIIYGGESPTAQSFTLMHEFAHVITGSSAISSGLSVGMNISSRNDRIEKWCNEFAASFLMPADAIRHVDGIPRTRVNEVAEDWLKTSAGAFGVSAHAFLLRLIDLGLVDQHFYWSRMRAKFLREESEYKSFGKPKYYGTRYVTKHGKLYTNLVLEAMNRGVLDAHNAANCLGIKNLKHLADIKSEARV